MKKTTRIVLALAVSVTLCGCQEQVNQEKKSFIPRNNLSKTYISLIEIQKKAVSAGLKAVDKYIDLETPSRSVYSNNNNISEIGKYLPDDLTTLRRTIETYTRNAEITGEEISLQEELSEIIDEFNSEFVELMPNPNKALSLPFVSATEGGLRIGDDTIVPYNTIEGAVNIEILNAMADGKDVETLLKEFEEDIELFFCSDSLSRSLWKTNTITWNKGVVNYRWGSLSEEHKNAVLVAMDEWSSKTENVSFEEIDNKGWTNFQLGIHTIGCVLIEDKYVGGNSGLSTIGYYGGNQSFLNLDPTIAGNTLKNTTLHELGHILGLYHEQQRYDRNDYLELTESEKNNEAYTIIPKELSNFRWGVKALRVGWWTIKIYYPIFWTTSESYIIGDFDFDSVMLYDGIKVKMDKQYLNSGKPKTVLNTKLSENDIKMIKEKY